MDGDDVPLTEEEYLHSLQEFSQKHLDHSIRVGNVQAAQEICSNFYTSRHLLLNAVDLHLFTTNISKRLPVLRLLLSYGLDVTKTVGENNQTLLHILLNRKLSIQMIYGLRGMIDTLILYGVDPWAVDALGMTCIDYINTVDRESFIVFINEIVPILIGSPHATYMKRSVKTAFECDLLLGTLFRRFQQYFLPEVCQNRSPLVDKCLTSPPLSSSSSSLSSSSSPFSIDLLPIMHAYCLTAPTHVNHVIDLKTGHTLLHLCTIHGDLRTIQFLLQQGADMYAVDAWDRIPIMYSVLLRLSNMYDILHVYIVGGAGAMKSDSVDSDINESSQQKDSGSDSHIDQRDNANDQTTTKYPTNGMTDAGLVSATAVDSQHEAEIDEDNPIPDRPESPLHRFNTADGFDLNSIVSYHASTLTIEQVLPATFYTALSEYQSSLARELDHKQKLYGGGLTPGGDSTNRSYIHCEKTMVKAPFWLFFLRCIPSSFFYLVQAQERHDDCGGDTTQEVACAALRQIRACGDQRQRRLLGMRVLSAITQIPSHEARLLHPTKTSFSTTSMGDTHAIATAMVTQQPVFRGVTAIIPSLFQRDTMTRWRERCDCDGSSRSGSGGDVQLSSSVSLTEQVVETIKQAGDTKTTAVATKTNNHHPLEDVHAQDAKGTTQNKHRQQEVMIRTIDDQKYDGGLDDGDDDGQSTTIIRDKGAQDVVASLDDVTQYQQQQQQPNDATMRYMEDIILDKLSRIDFTQCDSLGRTMLYIPLWAPSFTPYTGLLQGKGSPQITFTKLNYIAYCVESLQVPLYHVDSEGKTMLAYIASTLDDILHLYLEIVFGVLFNTSKHDGGGEPVPLHHTHVAGDKDRWIPFALTAKPAGGDQGHTASSISGQDTTSSSSSSSSRSGMDFEPAKSLHDATKTMVYFINLLQHIMYQCVITYDVAVPSNVSGTVLGGGAASGLTSSLSPPQPTPLTTSASSTSSTAAFITHRSPLHDCVLYILSSTHAVLWILSMLLRLVQHNHDKTFLIDGVFHELPSFLHARVFSQSVVPKLSSGGQIHAGDIDDREGLTELLLAHFHTDIHGVLSLTDYAQRVLGLQPLLKNPVVYRTRRAKGGTRGGNGGSGSTEQMKQIAGLSGPTALSIIDAMLGVCRSMVRLQKKTLDNIRVITEGLPMDDLFALLRSPPHGPHAMQRTPPIGVLKTPRPVSRPVFNTRVVTNEVQDNVEDDAEKMPHSDTTKSIAMGQEQGRLSIAPALNTTLTVTSPPTKGKKRSGATPDTVLSQPPPSLTQRCAFQPPATLLYVQILFLNHIWQRYQQYFQDSALGYHPTPAIMSEYYGSTQSEILEGCGGSGGGGGGGGGGSSNRNGDSDSTVLTPELRILYRVGGYYRSLFDKVGETGNGMLLAGQINTILNINATLPYQIIPSWTRVVRFNDQNLYVIHELFDNMMALIVTTIREVVFIEKQLNGVMMTPPCEHDDGDSGAACLHDETQTSDHHYGDRIEDNFTSTAGKNDQQHPSAPYYTRLHAYARRFTALLQVLQQFIKGLSPAMVTELYSHYNFDVLFISSTSAIPYIFKVFRILDTCSHGGLLLFSRCLRRTAVPAPPRPSFLEPREQDKRAAPLPSELLIGEHGYGGVFHVMMQYICLFDKQSHRERKMVGDRMDGIQNPHSLLVSSQHQHQHPHVGHGDGDGGREVETRGLPSLTSMSSSTAGLNVDIIDDTISVYGITSPLTKIAPYSQHHHKGKVAIDSPTRTPTEDHTGDIGHQTHLENHMSVDSNDTCPQKHDISSIRTVQHDGFLKTLTSAQQDLLSFFESLVHRSLPPLTRDGEEDEKGDQPHMSMNSSAEVYPCSSQFVELISLNFFVCIVNYANEHRGLLQSIAYNQQVETNDDHLFVIRRHSKQPPRPETISALELDGILVPALPEASSPPPQDKFSGDGNHDNDDVGRHNTVGGSEVVLIPSSVTLQPSVNTEDSLNDESGRNNDVNARHTALVRESTRGAAAVEPRVDQVALWAPQELAKSSFLFRQLIVYFYLCQKFPQLSLMPFISHVNSPCGKSAMMCAAMLGVDLLAHLYHIYSKTSRRQS